MSGQSDGPNEAAHEKVAALRGKARGATEQLRHRASELAGRAERQGQKGQERMHEAMEDHPIALGALSLGLGFAIGFALPRTRKEDEFFGRTRDRVVERARASALDAVDRGEEKLRERAERPASPSDQPAAM